FESILKQGSGSVAEVFRIGGEPFHYRARAGASCVVRRSEVQNGKVQLILLVVWLELYGIGEVSFGAGHLLRGLSDLPRKVVVGRRLPTRLADALKRLLSITHFVELES